MIAAGTSNATVILIALTVAGIGLVGAIVSPLAALTLAKRHREIERLEDQERQDQVAEKAAEVQTLLLKTTAASIARTDEVARLAAENVSDTNAQLRRIHKQVNSNLTEEKRDRLVVLEAHLTLMLELVAVKKAAGLQPSTETIEKIDTLRANISALQMTIAERTAQQELEA